MLLQKQVPEAKVAEVPHNVFAEHAPRMGPQVEMRQAEKRRLGEPLSKASISTFIYVLQRRTAPCSVSQSIKSTRSSLPFAALLGSRSAAPATTEA